MFSPYCVRSITQQYSPALLCRPGTVLHERGVAAGIPCYPAGERSRISAAASPGTVFPGAYVHDGNSKMRAILASLFSCGGTRVVATQHFVQPAYTQRGIWKGRMAGAAHRAANRVVAAHIAVSRAVLDAAVSRREVHDARVTVIPNGIITPDAPVPSIVQAKRVELGLSATDMVIVTVARLAPEKGIEYLIRAMTELQEPLPTVRLLVIGEGALRERLEAETAALGLQKQVNFLGFRPDVLNLVAVADIFVLPSLAEPFGIALVEAMALGKPTVAVCVGGPREIVEDRITGLLVPPADPHSLAQAIQRLLDQPNMSRAMGQAGQQRAIEHFSAAAMARQMEEVYRRCLSPRHLETAPIITALGEKVGE